MAVNVNPPPLLRIPSVFLSDGETREYLSQLNTIIFQLYNRTGGVDDSISEIGNDVTTNISPIAQQTIRELRGLPQLTIDTTGFTVDTTQITTDKVVA